jgi:hypothetical protein
LASTYDQSFTAVEKRETQGFMKIVVDADTREILGAAILGVGGDEAIHSILDVMYAKAPYTVIQRAVHIHPRVCELISTMVRELQPLAGQAGASTPDSLRTGLTDSARTVADPEAIHMSEKPR